MKYATIIDKLIILHDDVRSWGPSISVRILDPQVSNDNGFIVVKGEHVLTEFFFRHYDQDPPEMSAEKAEARYEPSAFEVVERKMVDRKIQWWPFKIDRKITVERVAVMNTGWALLLETRPIEMRFADAIIRRIQ